MTEEKKTTARKTTAKATGSKSKKTTPGTGTTGKASPTKATRSSRASTTSSKRKTTSAATNKTNAPAITIDGKDYPLDALNDNAKSQITNLRTTDRRIEELEAELAISRTARAAYASALERELKELDKKKLS